MSNKKIHIKHVKGHFFHDKMRPHLRMSFFCSNFAAEMCARVYQAPPLFP